MPVYGHSITPTHAIEETCATMEAKIQGTVSDLIKGLDYNGLHLVTDFIKFCEQKRKKDPKLSHVEIFHRFQLNSKEEALAHGTTCVGKAWEIVKRLKDIGVVAHVIVESEKLDGPAIHAAVAVPCRDGILLIEVEHDIPIIPLKPNEPFIKPPNPEYPDVSTSMKIVEVPGNYKTPTPMIVKEIKFTTETTEKKNSQTQYILRPESNPDQSVMKRWLVSEHTWYYPVSSAARAGKPQHALQINVAKNKITFSVGNEKYRISLDAFDPLKRTIDTSQLRDSKEKAVSAELQDFFFGKNGSFFDAFKTNKELLIDQIFTVVAHREMLKELREI